jgi:TolB protein
VKTLFFMGTLLGLVFAVGGGSLGRSSAEASAPILVTRSAASTGSVRAGARIAFACGREGLGLEVCVMNADGGGPRNLTRHPANDLKPSWSPDGRRIAFASDRHDGGPFDVYVMNASGGDQRLVTHGTDPAWSPDGRRIAFGTTSGLYLVNADGSGLRGLTRSGETPAWSPGGRRIAFSSGRGGNYDYEVYVMNADGTGRRNLTRNAADDHVSVGGWSPDGRRIVFDSDRGGNRDIYVMNADGSGQRNLTRNPAADLFAAWSPDGRRIAFTRDHDVYVMNADRSGQRNLTGNRGGAAPAWSPLLRS